jgi:hypothetical protein
MAGVKGCAALTARVLAGLSAAALVVMLPITMLTRNIALVLFEPQTLAQAISDQLLGSGILRETIVGTLLDESQAGVVAASLGSATQYLEPGEREAILGQLLPEAWVREQIEALTTDLLAWFDSPSTRLVLTVDTGAVAASLKGEAAGVVEMVVESWPACTLEDVGKMIGIGAVPGQQGFPFCEPPEPLRSVVVSGTAGALRLAAESLPARVTIVDQGYEDSDRLMQTKEQVRMLRFVARWGILASLALLGAITVLAVRSWRELTRWWGVPLLLGGLLAFLPPLLGGRLLDLLVTRLTAGWSGLPVLTELAQALVGAIGAAVLRPQAWQAAIVAGIALALLLLSLIRRRRSPAAAADRSDSPARGAVPLVSNEPPLKEPRDRPSGMFG